MALPTITPADFIGWIKIVANEFKQTLVQEYIDLFLPDYLRAIVGDAAFQDIENQTRDKWADLLNGAYFLNDEGKRCYYNGLVESLKLFIFFEFVRDNWSATQTGRVKAEAENSMRANPAEVIGVARSRYNYAVGYINQGLPGFLEANKEFNETITASVDNADNTYTLSIPNTKYLEGGDPVEINGVGYTVISATVDTNIVIDAGATGFDFTGDAVEWEPFEEVDFSELKPVGV